MKIIKMLKIVIGAEHAGRVARRVQMLIIFFTSGESFALVGLKTRIREPSPRVF